jgi:branched-chain amino acid transport system permease protein
MRNSSFWIGVVLVLVTAGLLPRLIQNEYIFIASFGVVQLVMLASAWNILGGYCGYINFGAAGFVAMGAYGGVVLGKALSMPLPGQIFGAALFGGALGFALGCLSLRLRGIFFAMSTLASSIILEILIYNLDYVGGARGMMVPRPSEVAFFGKYTGFLFFLMTFMAAGTVAIARYIQRSWIGRGMKALRDDEEAAEGCGVPTLRLKLLAAGVSGALMGMSGSLIPHLMSFIEPTSSFAINTSLLAMAMPMTGGTSHWVGPIIGALLLGAIQQVVTVTIRSELNVLIVGVVLVVMVIIAPKGIIGLAEQLKQMQKGRT